MLFVLDESLHVDHLPFRHHRHEVKPMRIGRKFGSLEEALEGIKPGLLSKKLSPKPYQLSEELRYFSYIASEEKELIYFYDPHYTSIELLRRIRSWLLPETRLLPIPIRGNIAEVFYFIEALGDPALDHDAVIGHRGLSAYIEDLQSEMRRWILSPMPAAVQQRKKRHAIYKASAKKMLLLMEVKQNQKVNMHGSGEWGDLWRRILESKPETHDIWAVCKGIADDLPTDAQVIHLEEPVLPVNVPFVEVVTGPVFQANLTEARI